MRYYAQNGEDKFLEPLLPDYGFFVDVGAWNGRHLSNTHFLVQKGWDGLEIEADPNRVAEMDRYLPHHIDRVCKRVAPDGLDELLFLYDVPLNFDLLSIDIDSYDWEIWRNLTKYEAKFVIIEVGSQVTPEAMLDLGNSKGYQLIWDKANFIFRKL